MSPCDVLIVALYCLFGSIVMAGGVDHCFSTLLPPTAMPPQFVATVAVGGGAGCWQASAISATNSVMPSATTSPRRTGVLRLIPLTAHPKWIAEAGPG